MKRVGADPALLVRPRARWFEDGLLLRHQTNVQWIYSELGTEEESR